MTEYSTTHRVEQHRLLIHSLLRQFSLRSYPLRRRFLLRGHLLWNFLRHFATFSSLLCRGLVWIGDRVPILTILAPFGVGLRSSFDATRPLGIAETPDDDTRQELIPPVGGYVAKVGVGRD